MQKKNFFQMLILVLLSSILLTRQAQSQLADSPWPMFMHDARYTGRSPYIGPKQPNLAWEKKVSNNKPIIGKNGIVYSYHSQDGYLALRLDGTIADTGDVARVQVVTRDNTIYFKHDNKFYALNPDGTKQWELEVGGSGSGNIVLDAQGDIFLDDGYYLSSIDPGGILSWQVPLTYSSGGRLICNPAIGQDGTIYVLDHDGLKAITQEGNLKWNFRIYSPSDCKNSISIGDDGTIYLGSEAESSSDYLFYAFNPDGSQKWRLKPYIGSPEDDWVADRGSFSSAAVGPDSTIYFGEGVWFSETGYLYALNPNGIILWTYKAQKGFPGSPIVDAEGKIYAVSGVGDLYCFDPNGTILWTYTISRPYGGLINYSYPAIDSLGTLYNITSQVFVFLARVFTFNYYTFN